MRDFRTTLRLQVQLNRVGWWLVWVILVVILVANVILQAIFGRDGSTTSGALAALPSYLAAMGIISASQAMPFALGLGMTRASFYRSSVAAMALLSIAWAAVATVLAEIEVATDGWGVGVTFFRIAGPLADSWYGTFAVMLAAMMVTFLTGWCFGIIHRRWGIVGVLIAIGVVLVAIAFVIVFATAPTVVPWLGRSVRWAIGSGVVPSAAAIAVVLGVLGHALVRRTAV